jgi:cytoskeleton protein RodZ
MAELTQSTPTASQPVTPGERLRQARESLNLPLQKVADDMHLDAWVIEAIESDQYTRLGAPVFIKGHLKHYAAMLRLPAGDVLTAYEAVRARPQVAEPPRPSAVRVAKETVGAIAEEIPRSRIAAIAGLVVMVGAMLWWRPWQFVSAPSGAASGATTATERGQNAPNAAAAGSPPGATGSTAAAPQASTPPAGASPVALSDAAAALVGARPARLRLSFSAESWVGVYDAGGKRLFDGLGAANSVKSLAGLAPFRINLGNANGVQVEVNDRTVAIDARYVRGEVAHFRVDASGVLRRP